MDLKENFVIASSLDVFLLKEMLTVFHRFLYTDKTKVTEENLEGLLFCADKYKTCLLAAQCRSSVKGFISTSIVCKVMEIAHRFNDTEIFEICLKKVDAHTPDFFFTEEFLNMCPSCIYKIVQRDSIFASEKVVFDQVDRWSKEECKRRGLPEKAENQREVLGDILKEIRFPMLEHQFLNDVVCETGILNDKEKVDILRQQLKAKCTKLCMFKKRERKWKATNLMICSVGPRMISKNLHDLNQLTRIAFTVQRNAFLLGIHLNMESLQRKDNRAIENLVVRIEPRDDRDTDQFIVPFSECVAEKYINLYPIFWIKLSKYTRYTLSIGIDCSKEIKGTNSFCYNNVTIVQKEVTKNYSQLSFAEVPLLALPRNMFDDNDEYQFDDNDDNHIVCGFCMTFFP